MGKRLYLTLSFGLIILLTGYYYAYNLSASYWIIRIVYIGTTIFSGLFVIGFNHKQIPKKIHHPIKLIYITPILLGVFGLILINYFIPFFVSKLMKWEWIYKSQPSESELPRLLFFLILSVFIEEFYFRRIIAQKIFNAKGFSKSLWISALIFSLAHVFTDIGLLSAFIGGLILGYIYLKTINIWLSIFAHLSYNLIMFIILPKITNRITDSITNIELIGMISLGLLLISGMVYFIEKLSKINIGNKASCQHRV